MPLGAVIVNRVLPELFTHSRRGDVRGAARARRRSRVLDRTRRARARPRCSTRARLAVSLRRTRAAHLDRAARGGRPAAAVRAVPVRARPRPARHAHGRRRARRGARPVSPRPEARATTLEQLLATKEIVVFCGSGGVGKTSVAAAAALGAAMPARRQGARAHHRPGQAARDRARSRRHRQRRAPGAARAAEGRRARAARRALGRDARHQAVVGRPRAAPRARTRRPRTGSSRTGCTTTSPRASCRATTTSRWSGCTRSTRRGEYDLIVIDTPPTRNAVDFLDAPDAHGRLLRRPAAALAHAAVPRRRQARQRACSTSPAGPSTKWPTACSAASSSRTSPSSSCNFQSMYDGFVDAREGGRAAAARPPHDVRGRHDARGGAAARGRALLRRARSTRDFHLGALVLNKTLPDYAARPRRRGGRDARSCDEAGAARRARSSALDDPALADPERTAAGAAHGRRVVPQLLGRRDARGGAARRARAACPTSSCASRLRGRHQRRRRARRDQPRLFADT